MPLSNLSFTVVGKRRFLEGELEFDLVLDNSATLGSVINQKDRLLVPDRTSLVRAESNRPGGSAFDKYAGKATYLESW